MKKEIRRKIPSAKHYIVYHGTIQGDLDTDVRRKTRAGRRWGMDLNWESPINSFPRVKNKKENSLSALENTKTEVTPANGFKMFQITKDIYPKQCFRDKMSRAPEDSDNGENVTEWARVCTLYIGTECDREGRNGRHLAAKRPAWAERRIGRQIYQFALVIARENGTDTKGSRIMSRKTVEYECEKAMGGRGRPGISFSNQSVSSHERWTDASCTSQSV